MSKRGFRGCDLEARHLGEPCERFSKADEVVLTIRGSKTDQLNRGEVRNHFRLRSNEPDADLCVVQALSDLEALAPEA